MSAEDFRTLYERHVGYVVSGNMKVLGLFVLLFVNVAFWASIAGVGWAAFDRLRRFRSTR